MVVDGLFARQLPRENTEETVLLAENQSTDRNHPKDTRTKTQFWKHSLSARSNRFVTLFQYESHQAFGVTDSARGIVTGKNPSRETDRLRSFVSSSSQSKTAITVDRTEFWK